jgi:hypothetical protein
MSKVDAKIKHVPFLITTAGVLLFAVVKFHLREMDIQNEVIQFLLGIYPNFLAGMMIPLLFLFKYDELDVAKVAAFDMKIKLIMVATLLFLIYEEFRPTIGSSKTFDVWDMVFSAVGLMVFLGVYRMLRMRKMGRGEGG